jgi:putative transposase
MKYQEGQVYHVFNQGNNRQKIFFQSRNYPYFIEKMRKYILPHADLLAYCLMPNHFHWLIRVKAEGCAPSKAQRPLSKAEELHISVDSENSVAENLRPLTRQQKLGQAIGVLISSYAKAINKQEGWSGSLFRAKTKTENGMGDPGFTVYGPKILSFPPITYWQTCFNYIHDNPVKAELVDFAEDWPYSSAADYRFHRRDSICNVRLAKALGIGIDARHL